MKNTSVPVESIYLLVFGFYLQCFSSKTFEGFVVVDIRYQACARTDEFHQAEDILLWLTSFPFACQAVESFPQKDFPQA